MRLCFDAHRDQTDKSGLPYVFHPFHVAEQMQTEETVAVALLHNVVVDDKAMRRVEKYRQAILLPERVEPAAES